MGNAPSFELYNDLEKNGFSEEKRKRKRNFIKHVSRILMSNTQVHKSFKLYASIGGSCCEGTYIEQSDVDLVCFSKLGVCTDGKSHTILFNLAETLFDPEHPGYIYLLLKDEILIK